MRRRMTPGAILPAVMLLAAILLAAVAAVARPAAARDALTVGLNDRGAHPYVVGEGEALAEPPGLTVDLMREVGRHLDIDMRFVRMPGLRVLTELKAGHVDAALLYSHSPDRETFGAYPMRSGRPDPSRRLATLSYTLYKPRGSALDWTGERFVNLDGPIGANLNYSIVRDLRELGANVVEVRTTADSFRMLRAGRIDGVADHEAVADAYLTAAGITGVEKVGPPLREKPYYLMLSHQYVSGHPERATAIWDLVGELRDRVLRDAMPKYLDQP